MRRLATNCAVTGLLVFVSGCVERTLTLYPDNDTARTVGPLQAKMLGHGNLNGTITMRLPSGQVLEGRYSIGLGGGAGEADMMSPQGMTGHCEL